jgi:hypothetical protein
MTAALLIAAVLALHPRWGETVTEVGRAEFGRFALVEERHDLPPTQMPRLHGPADRWVELHLVFRSTDAATEIALVDNGAALTFELWSERCTSSTRYLAFQGRVGEPRLFAQFADAVALHYRTCPGAGPALARSRAREMRAARADFAAGVQAMKAREETLFQGWRTRCRMRTSGGGRAGPVVFLPDHGSCPGGML